VGGMNVIQVDNLTRDYGKKRGVFRLNFAVQEGEVFGFLGPNGAGKTTTIRHLMGFLRAKQGRCTISGKDCWRESSAVQKSLGYIPGEMAFPEGMTGNGFLRF
jgi:ABC-2 type transport system ATP-binding protein